MDDLVQQFEKALLSCQNSLDVETLRQQYFGKKGIVPELLQKFREVLPSEKKAYGEKVHALKAYVEGKIEQKTADISSKEMSVRMNKEAVDTSLPGRMRNVGGKHPLTGAIDDIVGIMKDLGFSVQVGPQIETDYYNFEVLNFPPDHPAKDMQDTFYIEPGLLLRPHTSPVQARIMEKAEPPIRIVCPGRVFRNEDVSARSHAFFHQVEALYIDKNVSMQDLYWTFREFVRRLFRREDLEVRFRPSYFPFVEPGTECDAMCLLCNGVGCPLCKGSGWLEICGAGMVHPKVLRNVGIDPEKYQGYAWGLGVERIVMLMRGIKDIRLFAENDLRFLHQFHLV